MKKFLGFDNVLCLSPHPDDTEYSMFLTMQQHPGTRFSVVLLTNGTPVDPTSGPERIREFRTFWKSLDLPNVSPYPFIVWTSAIDSQIPNCLHALEEKFPTSNFQAVCGPPLIDSHIEHQTVHKLMLAYARQQPISVLEYKTISAQPDWTPNLRTVYNEDQVTQKIELLQKAYVSQMDGVYFDSTVLRAFHQDFYDLKRGVQFTEQYKIISLYQGLSV